VAAKHINKIILGLGIGIIANLSTLVPAWAQQFTVSPMVTISEAKSGQAKGSIYVTNKGKEPLRVRVYAENFTYDPKKGFVSISNHDRSAVPYLQFSPRELQIPPGVTRNVRVVTLLPPSLPSNEYRAVVFIEDLKEREVKSNNQNAVVIKARVASVFYISKGTSGAEVQSTTAVWDNSAKKLSILLVNKGKRTAFPDVNWRIEKDGKEIAKDQTKGILVQSENEREIALQIKGKPVSLGAGNYSLVGDIVSTGQNTPFNIKVMIP
jgi:P pilus assembly chaperone PapD